MPVPATLGCLNRQQKLMNCLTVFDYFLGFGLKENTQFI